MATALLLLLLQINSLKQHYCPNVKKEFDISA